MNSKSVLLIDDDSDFLAILTERCHSLGLATKQARNLLTAVYAIKTHLPDIICVDVEMPTGNGLQFCRMLREEERTRAIPVVVLTANLNLEIRHACNELSVHYVSKSSRYWAVLEPLLAKLIAPPLISHARTDDCERLMDAVFSFLGDDHNVRNCGSEDGLKSLNVRESEPSSVLCIDDDLDFAAGLSIRLQELGIEVVHAKAGMDGYRSAFVSPVQAITLDYSMPNGRGDYILARLKDNPITKDIPVIVITGQRDKIIERRMYAMGAKAYLTKPLDFRELTKALSDCGIVEIPSIA
jgi:CheY-like chemotaxis protein